MTARIHVQEHVEPHTIEHYCGGGITTPRIDLYVQFDHGTHQRALTALEAAYHRAVAQIEETR